MSAVIWLAVLTLLLATYVAAVNIALLRFSPGAFAREQEARAASPRATARLLAHLRASILAVSLVRQVLRVAFFVLILAAVVGVGESAMLTWPRLLLSAGLTVGLLWVTSTVVASAWAVNAGSWLVATALPWIHAVSLLCAPLTASLSFVDEAVRRLSGAHLQNGEDVAEAELLRSIEETHRQGALDEDAAALLENVVEFHSTDVGEVMTPRTDIEGIQCTDDLGTIREFIMEAGHSRIPVYRESLDDIVGILYVKDLVPFLGEDARAFRLEPLLRQPIVVPETKAVRDLLADFQRSEVHMAIVVDEYGGTSGLVTIEDVLEEIVGEIHDEHEPEDEVTPTLTEVSEHYAEVDGRYHIDDLNEKLGLDLPEDADYDTIGGFVLAELGRVPSVGESFESHSARFTAVDASPTHVVRVGVERIAHANGEPVPS